MTDISTGSYNGPSVITTSVKSKTSFLSKLFNSASFDAAANSLLRLRRKEARKTRVSRSRTCHLVYEEQNANVEDGQVSVVTGDTVDGVPSQFTKEELKVASLGSRNEKIAVSPVFDDTSSSVFTSSRKFIRRITLKRRNTWKVFHHRSNPSKEDSPTAVLYRATSEDDIVRRCSLLPPVSSEEPTDYVDETQTIHPGSNWALNRLPNTRISKSLENSIDNISEDTVPLERCESNHRHSNINSNDPDIQSLQGTDTLNDFTQKLIPEKNGESFISRGGKSSGRGGKIVRSLSMKLSRNKSKDDFSENCDSLSQTESDSGEGDVKKTSISKSFLRSFFRRNTKKMWHSITLLADDSCSLDKPEKENTVNCDKVLNQEGTVDYGYEPDRCSKGSMGTLEYGNNSNKLLAIPESPQGDQTLLLGSRSSVEPWTHNNNSWKFPVQSTEIFDSCSENTFNHQGDVTTYNTTNKHGNKVSIYIRRVR